MVPKETLSRIDEALCRRKSEFEAEVEAFVEKYEEEREKAGESLGYLFSESDYPINVRQKFRFEWRFITLDIPGKPSRTGGPSPRCRKSTFDRRVQAGCEFAEIHCR